MKKTKYIIFLILLFLVNVTVKAATVYQVNDFIYYDPVTNGKCDETNYWTIYNQNTTCYRFIILDNEDNQTKETIKIMLDHNIGIDTFDNYQTVLKENTSDWTGYINKIDIIDEDTIYKLMKLTKKPEITDDNSQISVKGTVPHYFFNTNSYYYINGKLTNEHGFWSKDTYNNDENYAYTVTEFGYNKLIKKTEKRGIRPVITINKTLVSKGNNHIIDITNELDSKLYSFKSANKANTGNTIYKQLQGFTVVKDKLIFYSSNKATPNKGVLFTYNGNNYEKLFKLDNINGGHGNDLTYNSKTNKILLVGPNSYSEIYEYNATTLELENKHKMNNISFSSIAYDEINDYYIGGSGKRAYILDSNFNILYSFDMPSTETYQGMEYHNGYIYNAVYEGRSCSNQYQIYCIGKEFSNYIEVYNAKIDSQGNPHQDFGHLVQKIYVDSGIGELESVSFTDNKMYLGFAAHRYDATNVFKFFTIDTNKIEPNNTVDYNITATGTKENYTINITSNEELLSTNGWTISEDKKTLSLNGALSDITLKVTLCDLFSNCQDVSVPVASYLTDLPATKVPDNKEKNKETKEEVEVIETNQVIEETPHIEAHLEELPVTGTTVPIVFLTILSIIGIILIMIYIRFYMFYRI